MLVEFGVVLPHNQVRRSGLMLFDYRCARAFRLNSERHVIAAYLTQLWAAGNRRPSCCRRGEKRSDETLAIGRRGPPVCDGRMPLRVSRCKSAVRWNGSPACGCWRSLHSAAGTVFFAIVAGSGCAGAIRLEFPRGRRRAGHRIDFHWHAEPAARLALRAHPSLRTWRDFPRCLVVEIGGVVGS